MSDTKTNELIGELTQAAIAEGVATEKAVAIAGRMLPHFAAALREMVPVVSSNIESIGFDKQQEELLVSFKSGGTYLYEAVDFGTFEKILAAPSQGKFFHAAVRNKFAHKKVQTISG